MCTRDKEFTIRGISDCLARGYDRTGFFEVDTGEQRAWTVQLTESSEQAPQRPLPAGNPLAPVPVTPPAATLRRSGARARARRTVARKPEPMRRQRRTKVVATLGPASSSHTVIGRLFAAGADVFRINMSHTSHDKMRELVATIRAVEAECDRPIGILVDLAGTEAAARQLQERLCRDRHRAGLCPRHRSGAGRCDARYTCRIRKSSPPSSRAIRS